MNHLLTSVRRRAWLAAFGAGMFSPPDWLTGRVMATVPTLRTILDSPRCALERHGMVAPARGRFRPGDGGTSGTLRCTPAEGPVLTGARMDDSLIIVSGFGGVVQRVAPDGKEVWRKSAIQPRGLLVVGPHVLVGSGRRILWLNKQNGQEVGASVFDWPVNAFSLRGKILAVAFRRQGPGSVRLYELDGQEVREVARVPGNFSYPRGVCLTADSLYVADTFSHKVLRYEGRNADFSRLAVAADSFYPNSVRLTDGKLLVTEEHINQMAMLDPRTLARLPTPAGCWSHGRAVPLAALLARVNEHTTDGESVCRARSVLGFELLALNDAVQSKTALYIADTDNHRIVMYKGGVPVAALSNFNEPVNVELVP